VADFVLGPFTTALESQELVVEIGVPVPEPGSGSSYVSVEHPASGFALAGAAALVGDQGAKTVALTGVGSRPTLLPGDLDPGEAIAVTEILGDGFAPADYRRELARTMTRRALERAAARAAEDR
jgi:carbon-monoxide dehydrogenase medium subunit